MQICEVTAATTRHQDLFAYLVGTFEDQNSSATLPGGDGAHQASCATAEDDDIVVAHPGNITVSVLLRCRLRFRTLDGSQNFDEAETLQRIQNRVSENG